MIKYDRFTLDNGLQVLVHEDFSTPVAVVNILYNVGSKDEDENKTGFAHLFEHLMFGGSKHIGNFDEPLQKVGGENNAFTSPDITNYYVTLPAVNIETAFWLESDRMLGLSFDPNVLEVQRSVVIEEFKQRYLNQPYGDAWLKMRPLAYKTHPYKWATIGKEVSHIENATMEDVKAFFYKFYIPNNAIMVVAGGVKTEDIKRMAEKWFGPIPAGKPYKRNLPQEAPQTEERRLEVESPVPLDAIYKAYHVPGKNSDGFYAADLLSDILGRGKSSRLYNELVKEQKLFSSLHAHCTNSVEPGLISIEGKLNKGISLEEADKAIQNVIEILQKDGLKLGELEKVKNQAESTLLFDEVEVLHRAMNLAFAALLGDPEIVNQESVKIQSTTKEDVIAAANKYLVDTNCSTMFYRSKIN
jgi:zinc protease